MFVFGEKPIDSQAKIEAGQVGPLGDQQATHGLNDCFQVVALTALFPVFCVGVRFGCRYVIPPKKV